MTMTRRGFLASMALGLVAAKWLEEAEEFGPGPPSILHPDPLREVKGVYLLDGNRRIPTRAWVAGDDCFSAQVLEYPSAKVTGWEMEVTAENNKSLAALFGEPRFLWGMRRDFDRAKVVLPGDTLTWRVFEYKIVLPDGVFA